MDICGPYILIIRDRTRWDSSSMRTGSWCRLHKHIKRRCSTSYLVRSYLQFAIHPISTPWSNRHRQSPKHREWATLLDRFRAGGPRPPPHNNRTAIGRDSAALMCDRAYLHRGLIAASPQSIPESLRKHQNTVPVSRLHT